VVPKRSRYHCTSRTTGARSHRVFFRRPAIGYQGRSERNLPNRSRYCDRQVIGPISRRTRPDDGNIIEKNISIISARRWHSDRVQRHPLKTSLATAGPTKVRRRGGEGSGRSLADRTPRPADDGHRCSPTCYIATRAVPFRRAKAPQ